MSTKNNSKKKFKSKLEALRWQLFVINGSRKKVLEEAAKEYGVSVNSIKAYRKKEQKIRDRLNFETSWRIYLKSEITNLTPYKSQQQLITMAQNSILNHFKGEFKPSFVDIKSFLYPFIIIRWK